MQYTQYHPHASLQPHIASYFSMEVNEAKPGRELVLPDGTHGLIFVQNAGFVREPVSGKGQQIKGSYLFGQKTRSVYYSLDTPGLSCFGVKFQPTGLQALIGVQASEFTDQVEDTKDVMERSFSQLYERVAETHTNEEKAKVLDQYFLARMPDDEQLDLVNAILADIYKSLGCIGIIEITKRFGISYKRLARLFQKYVGVTPKAYCRLTRFHSTLSAAGNTGWGNLTRLCYESGYYDQMHFIREVRRYTGMTPKHLYSCTLGILGNHQASLVSARLKLRQAS